MIRCSASVPKRPHITVKSPARAAQSVAMRSPQYVLVDQSIVVSPTPPDDHSVVWVDSSGL